MIPGYIVIELFSANTRISIIASYFSYLVERFIGQMVVKFCFLIVTDSLDILCTICVLGICVGYFGAKFNFRMQARFQFFWKYRRILTYISVFLMDISIIFL
jgi:hypothetical protein